MSTQGYMLVCLGSELNFPADADPALWYFEPPDWTGQYLYSAGYPTCEDACAAAGVEY